MRVHVVAGLLLTAMPVVLPARTGEPGTPGMSQRAAGSTEARAASASTAQRSASGARPLIAVFAGATATILNVPPLVTSNKARVDHGLPLITRGGTPVRFDHLVPQRLAAPVDVYIEPFSAHPLERDASDLYGPPDGYLDAKGGFHATRQSPGDRPVYKVTLRPEDGLYLLPYAARQADGSPWDGVCAARNAPPEKCRQTFFPDAARLFEEIDRGVTGRTTDGRANALSNLADFEFFRALPSAGYRRGLPAKDRTDEGEGDIAPETEGEDYFPYMPYRRDPRREDLARVTNVVQRAMRTGKYAGAIWLEGSHNVQETTYWLNLLIDTDVPIAGNSAQRTHGSVGAEGDENIVDSVEYILSKKWAGPDGKDRIGAVMVQDQQIFNARSVEKEDARPGGYRAVQDHGVIGSIGPTVTIWSRPAPVHTYESSVNVTRLPTSVPGLKFEGGLITIADVRIKDDAGDLLGSAIPKVTTVKYNRYFKDSAEARPEEEVEMLARIDSNLRQQRLAGFVVEGLTAAGNVQESLEKAIDIAAMSGMPVVRVTRGDHAAVVPSSPSNLTIEGRDLTPIKARLLLMATLLKFGALPPARDPRNPTEAEKKAVRERIALYQEVFDTH